jgi:hypothetical protein
LALAAIQTVFSQSEGPETPALGKQVCVGASVYLRGQAQGEGTPGEG